MQRSPHDYRWQRHRHRWIPTSDGSTLPARKGRGPLTVCTFADLHGHALELPGLLRAYLDKQPAPSLLLGGGDDHAGLPALDATFADPSTPDPAYAAFAAARVDAFVPGNHDFDASLETLLAKWRLSPGPIPVCTNVHPASALAEAAPPCVIFDVDDWHVGVLGLLTKGYLAIDPSFLTEPLAAIAPWLEFLTARGILPIVLSHLGLMDDAHYLPGWDDRDLAPLLPAHALLCGAHAHLVRAHRLGLHPGHAGSHFGLARWDGSRWTTTVINALALSQKSPLPA